MAAPTVQIQKKSNPAVKKKIQEKALPLFQKRGWELVSGEAITKASITETKKKDVEPVEKGESGLPDSENTGGENGSDIVGVSIDQLREEYQTISGKDPDKRWKEPRLKEEIEKLTTQK